MKKKTHKRYSENIIEEINNKYGRSFNITLGGINISFAERNASERHAFNRVSNGDNLVDVINEYYGKVVL
jgi:hypothetical protein